MLRRLLALLAVLVAGAALGAPGDVPVPKLTAHVVDLTSTLDAQQREALDAKLRAFEAARGSQIAVLIMPTLGGESIEEFSTRVTDAWQLGRKGVDDGVLLLVAKQEHRVRIQTGRGVQGTLTDALSSRIIEEIITPRFRSGDFAGGIDAGVDAIMKAVQGEDLPLPAAKKAARASQASYSDFVFLAFFLVPVVAMVLRSIAGRLVGAGLTSGLTGVAAWLVFGSLGLGVFAALLAFVFTLFSGIGITRGIGPGGWGGGWGGGFGGGFGGGGGGFGGGGGGGFSGGGGSFDGGGASGQW